MEDKKGDNELKQHADNNGLPFDGLRRCGRSVHHEDDDKEAENLNGTIGAYIVSGLFGDEGAQ